MPDDALITARTAIDTTGLAVGMAEANTISRAQLEILKESYRTTATDIRQTVNRIVDAEKQAAEATATAHTQLATTLQKVANDERLALDQLIAKQTQLEGSLAAMKAALSTTSTAVKEETNTIFANTLAVEQMGSAHARAVPEIAAASSAIRTFEGRLPIRAVEYFATRTLGLGPLLMKAFPIIGAIALIEVVYRAGEAVYNLYQKFVNLKEVQEELTRVSIQMADGVVSAVERMNTHIVAILRSQGKLVEAAKKEAQDALSKPIKFGEPDKDKLGALMPEQIGLIRKAFDELIPTDLPDRISDVKNQLQGLKYTGPSALHGTQAQIDMTKEFLAGQLSRLEAEQGRELKAAEEFKVKTEKAAEDEQSKKEALAHKAEAAFRAREAAVRKADEDAFADLRSSHELTIQETAEFWQKRLALETQYGDRVREIKNKLGTLYQEQDRENAKNLHEYLSRGMEDAKVSGGAEAELEFLKKFAEAHKDLSGESSKVREVLEAMYAKLPELTKNAQKEIKEELKKGVEERFEEWVTEHRRTEQQVIAFWSGVKSMYSANAPLVEEATKRIAAATEKWRVEQEKLAQIKIAGIEGGQLGESQMKKLEVQRESALSTDTSTAAKLRELEVFRQIDAEEAASRIDAAQKTMSAIAALYGAESTQYAAEVNKRAQLQRVADQQWHADTTKILATQKQQYDTFFNGLNQSLNTAISGMLTGQRSWGQSMLQIQNQLESQFIGMVGRRVLEWAEGTDTMKAIEQAWSSMLLALHITTAATTVAIDKTKSTVEKTDAAGVGAANTYASASGIPVIGPFIAPALSAATYSAIMAFETGGYIPNTGIALVHGGESVMNRQVTSKMMQMTENGGDQNTMNNTIHIHPQASAAARQTGAGAVDQLFAYARRNNFRIA